MPKISQYIIKDIPESLWTMKISGEHQQAFKNALSNYLDNEHSEGFLLVGIDFHCRIAIFRNFLLGI